jgi:hypothetical protein
MARDLDGRDAGVALAPTASPGSVVAQFPETNPSIEATHLHRPFSEMLMLKSQGVP